MRSYRYFYEDGEKEDDAHKVPGKHMSDWSAAQAACEDDFNSRDGWERPGTDEFVIIVIDDKDNKTRWICSHQPTVEHTARKARD